MLASDPNASLFSTPGTPLKSIENVCSSVIANSISDGGNDVSLIGSSHPTFVRPRQTSTPAAAARISTGRFVPPFGKAVTDSALGEGSSRLTTGGCWSQEGGFLPESQAVGLTPVGISARPTVFDLTVDEVPDSVTNTQFRPTLVSTQITSGTSGIRGENLHPRFADFENSFVGNDGGFNPNFDGKGTPVATSTQISPRAIATHGVDSHQLGSGVLENGFSGNPVENRMTSEVNGGNRMQSDTGTVSTTVTESCTDARNGTVSKPTNSSPRSQSEDSASRSSSPELFDCDDIKSEKETDVDTTLSPSKQSGGFPCMVRSTEYGTVDSVREASLPCTTLAQKLAGKKQKAETSTAHDVHSTVTGSSRMPVKGSSIPEAKGLLEKESESCSQTRTSAQTSICCRMSLRSFKRQKRGVDFLDEIDEVLTALSVVCELGFMKASARGGLVISHPPSANITVCPLQHLSTLQLHGIWALLPFV